MFRFYINPLPFIKVLLLLVSIMVSYWFEICTECRKLCELHSVKISDWKLKNWGLWEPWNKRIFATFSDLNLLSIDLKFVQIVFNYVNYNLLKYQIDSSKIEPCGTIKRKNICKICWSQFVSYWSETFTDFSQLCKLQSAKISY